MCVGGRVDFVLVFVCCEEDNEREKRKTHDYAEGLFAALLPDGRDTKIHKRRTWISRVSPVRYLCCQFILFMLLLPSSFAIDEASFESLAPLRQVNVTSL